MNHDENAVLVEKDAQIRVARAPEIFASLVEGQQHRVPVDVGILPLLVVFQLIHSAGERQNRTGQILEDLDQDISSFSFPLQFERTILVDIPSAAAVCQKSSCPRCAVEIFQGVGRDLMRVQTKAVLLCQRVQLIQHRQVVNTVIVAGVDRIRVETIHPRIVIADGMRGQVFFPEAQPLGVGQILRGIRVAIERDPSLRFGCRGRSSSRV